MCSLTQTSYHGLKIATRQQCAWPDVSLKPRWVHMHVLFKQCGRHMGKWHLHWSQNSKIEALMFSFKLICHLSVLWTRPLINLAPQKGNPDNTAFRVIFCDCLLSTVGQLYEEEMHLGVVVRYPQTFAHIVLPGTSSAIYGCKSHPSSKQQELFTT